MARYVLLSFDTDEKAERFLQYMGVKDGDDIDTALAALEVFNYAHVEGEYQKPTKFCECPGLGRGNSNYKEWAKGKKWGWWIHKPCGLPNQGQAQGSNFPYLGKNLLGKKVGDRWEMQ
jgi:hypothetical protein